MGFNEVDYICYRCDKTFTDSSLDRYEVVSFKDRYPTAEDFCSRKCFLDYYKKEASDEK